MTDEERVDAFEHWLTTIEEMTGEQHRHRYIAHLARIGARIMPRSIEKDGLPQPGETVLAFGRYQSEPEMVKLSMKKSQDTWWAVHDGNHVIEYQSDFGTDYKTTGPFTHYIPLSNFPIPEDDT